MFFLPIRTDRRQKHKPWVNYALIAINVVAFMITQAQIAQSTVIQYNFLQSTGREMTLPELFEALPAMRFLLYPTEPQLYQFLTSQFLHGDIWHLLGNMVFLYVFGNVLEDKLGKVSYLMFYLTGGIWAGLAHAATSVAPVLGASGAVAAVTGAFLALLPKTDVTIFYWFGFVMGTFEVSGMVLVIYQIILNIVLYFMGSQGVAYLAHLGGYAFGFVIGMGLLYTRLMPREPFDLLSLIEHRRRRAQFQSIAKKGFEPWHHQHGHVASSGGRGKRGSAKPQAPEPLNKKQLKILEYREQIGDALRDQDLPLAAMRYLDLLEIDDAQVLSQESQLELANHFMQQQRYRAAAGTYERFLKAYGSYTQRDEIELILGLIYARYLDDKDRARQLLTSARDRLHDPDKIDLARSMLEKLG